ncbi:MAG: ImmA/IrrE family metallo-endopeptidase [Syntrophomonadaceae bacterium]|nr:ImmA/IrrE family metallo-endopeptidase [Syntrophomonadaceae bacterium]
MRYDVLHDIVEREGINLIYWDFAEPVRGLYVRQPGIPPFIGISTAILDIPAEYYSVLGEEIGHHFTIPINMISTTCLNYQDRLSISALEHKALCWAAQFLIDIDDIRSALAKGYNNHKDLSTYFGLTEELVTYRMGMPDAIKLCYEQSLMYLRNN